MGRMKPAYYYERLANKATARANYYRNRAPSTSTTVDSRPATELYYRSLTKRLGTDPIIYRVSVSNASLQLMSAANAGLLATLAAEQVAFPIRSSGVKPTRAAWYKGDTNPQGRTTPYGSRWIRYYDIGGDQSHHSVPFSRATGAFDAQDLENAFTTFFNNQTNKTNLLGAENGRAQLIYEKSTNVVTT